MITIKRHIPNFITCLNLAAGFFGIVLGFENLVIASYCIFAAAIFDFFDGFAARMLNVSSAIGKELDSLADMVTFGVLPGVILWKLMEMSLLAGNAMLGMTPGTGLIFLSVLIPVFSGLRLAKFNIDTRQAYGFIGLPTPANAIFFASLPLILEMDDYKLFITDLNFLTFIGVIFPFLLVSEIPLFALKFQSFSFKENRIKYLFLLVSLLLLIFLQVLAIPAIIILYVLFSVASNFAGNKHRF